MKRQTLRDERNYYKHFKYRELGLQWDSFLKLKDYSILIRLFKEIYNRIYLTNKNVFIKI